MFISAYSFPGTVIHKLEMLLLLLIPNTGEMEGDGYHWLNVLYEANGIRCIGWMARDSFSTNGQRDPSIATLRHAGTQAAC